MNISIFHYSSPDALIQLCMHLDITPEVANRLAFHIGSMDLAPFEPYFRGLFSLDTGKDAATEISALCRTAEDPTGDSGMKVLAVLLAAAQHTQEVYDELGINDVIYFDTIKAFSRFLNEHKTSFGHFGFDRHLWIYRQLSARLFRLGALEFEIYTLPKDASPIGTVPAGSPMLSVHIPSDAVMTREALDASYRMARDFFAEFFPSYPYQCVYCSSWLLSPILKKILKPGSRIIDFQSDYEITHVDLETNGGINWVFKRDYDDYTKLPEETSLMRGMKRILLEGRKTGVASGYVKNFYSR